jgi:hypothetical protein
MRQFLATYPTTLMKELVDWAWGLGFVTTRDIRYKLTAESGQWTAEHTKDATKVVDDFVKFVSDVLGKASIFEDAAISTRLQRFRSFIATSILEVAPGLEYSYERRYSKWPVVDGTPVYSQFMDKLHQEFSELVKDVIAVLGLMTRTELEHFVPSLYVKARLGLGIDVPEPLRTVGRDMFGSALLSAMRGAHILKIPTGEGHTLLYWEYFIASFFRGDLDKPLILDPKIDMGVFLSIFLSQTTRPASQNAYYQHWKIVNDNRGINHWKVVRGTDGKTRIYFEIEAIISHERRVCYMELDALGHARPLAEGFGAFVDPSDRSPTARWDDSADLSLGDYAGKPTLIGAGGVVNDLAAPGSSIPETDVDPSTWQCLTVLLDGWGPPV